MAKGMVVWRNEKTGKYVRGYWSYNWSGDSFSISVIDRCGLRNHDFITCNDHPEWGNYKLVRDGEEIEKALASFKK